MKAEVRLPPLGETVERATITNWYKQPGDWVDADEPLYEVETDKVVTDVPAPGAGYVVSIMAEAGSELPIGAVLAVLASDPEAHADVAVDTVDDAQPASSTPSTTPGPPVQQDSAATGGSSHRLPPRTDERVRSPLVRRLIAEHALDASTIEGKGHGGRITRSDVEAALAARSSWVTPRTQPSTPPASAPAAASSELIHAPGDQRVAFSTIRRITAEHMVRSKATSAHTLTIVQVDYERIAQVRARHGAEFKQQTGVSLTYLPFIIRATVDALRAFPRLNASVGHDELVLHQHVDLGVAVALGMEALVVPVIRRVEDMRLRGIALALADVAERARAKQLGADDLKGGSFTVTNPGGYGTYAGAAIINQPQVGILNTDGIAKEPVVVEREGEPDSIAIHYVGRLSLSWDHRAIDGLYAAAFLDSIRDSLQSRDWSQEL